MLGRSKSLVILLAINCRKVLRTPLKKTSGRMKCIDDALRTMTKHFVLPDLYGGLARLLGINLASSTTRDYAPRDPDGSIISV